MAIHLCLEYWMDVYDLFCLVQREVMTSDFTLESLMLDSPVVKSIARHIRKGLTGDYRQTLYDSRDRVLPIVKSYEEVKKYGNI